MPVLLLVGRVEGTLVPWRSEDHDELMRYPERQVLKIKVTKPRSQKAHAFYFATIAAACKQWPQGQAPCPGENDYDLLRAWLQCKAGYADHIAFPTGTQEALKLMAKRIGGDGRYCFIDERETKDGWQTFVFTPKSIAYDEMDETEFKPLRTAVFEVIEEVLGITVDELMYQTKETNPEAISGSLR